MGKTLPALDDKLIEFIARQRIFFVATAPADFDGHVNLSPKGMDTFRVLDERTVAYLDLTGSGIETVAHLRENGRIAVMFCAFEGPPQIVRLHGRGAVLELGSEGYGELIGHFPAHPGSRAIIRIAVERVSTSCGWAVPLMRFEGERTILNESSERKGEPALAAYRAEKNALSIDGLPGLGVP
ncbi:MAG TPA: pyridoxamine 5'-phosphate oxidase family protein [Egibacteraceae bacterium]|nr:pyridoxamine 5'-phosphate oxidase family protein [Egibacteraceae bacterium]